MKNFKKKLFGIGLAFSIMLGVTMSFTAQEAEAKINPGFEDAGKCKAELNCGKGGKASCEGKKSCSVQSWYVECDGVTSYCRT